MTNQHCEGCKTHSEYVHNCETDLGTTVNPNGECPCTYCLIKSVCDHPCREYDNFRKWS